MNSGDRESNIQMIRQGTKKIGATKRCVTRFEMRICAMRKSGLTKILAASMCLLQACTFTQTSEPLIHAVDSNTRKLSDQKQALDTHTELLDEIHQTQQELSKQLNGIEKKLKQLDEIKSDIANVKVVQKPQEESKVLVLENRNREANTEKLDGDEIRNIEGSKVLIGRNEWVWIDLIGQTLKSRVDTGANTSSLSAMNVQPFERDGKKWVRFTLPDDKNKGAVYETPLVRYTKVKHASMEKMDRRAVVSLVVRMGNISEESEFTLTNRENMLYPVLLGRSFLKDIAIVDVAKKFTQDKFEQIGSVKIKTKKSDL